jgi:hypothetical protein
VSLGSIDIANPVNLQHPLARGLAGFFYPLHGRGGGYVYDLMGNHIPAGFGDTLNVTKVIPLDRWNGNKLVWAASPGPDEGLFCLPNSATRHSGGEELSVFVRGSFNTTSINKALMSHWGSSGQRAWQIITRDLGSSVRFQVSTSSNSSTTTPLNGYNDNIIRGYGGTFKSDSFCRVFVDGDRKGNVGGASGTIVIPNNTTRICSWNTAGRGDNPGGEWVYSMYWNRALSDSEMRWLHEESLHDFPTLLNRISPPIVGIIGGVTPITSTGYVAGAGFTSSQVAVKRITQALLADDGFAGTSR